MMQPDVGDRAEHVATGRIGWILDWDGDPWTRCLMRWEDGGPDTTVEHAALVRLGIDGEP